MAGEKGMKKQELDIAIATLQRIQADYVGMFDLDGGVIRWYESYKKSTRRTPTATAEELRYVRRLLLEVARELD